MKTATLVAQTCAAPPWDAMRLIGAACALIGLALIVRHLGLVWRELAHRGWQQHRPKDDAIAALGVILFGVGGLLLVTGAVMC